MDRVLRLGALNIVTQPHSPDTYAELMLRVRNRRKAGRIRGDRFGMIALMPKAQNPGAIGAFTQGLLGTFTQIDEKKDWINVSTGKKAELEELAAINIPKDLRPNLTYSRFRFYFREHLLVFEIGNSGARLTPNNAKHLFDRLFNVETIIREFGEVSVTVYPMRNTIDRIMTSSSLKSLHLVTYAPNPDDGTAAERAFMNRLERMNVRKIEQYAVAKKGESILPDEALANETRIAADNGSAVATLKENGRTIKVSTVDTPFIYTHEYNDRSNTEEAEFGIAADIVRHQLRQKRS